VQLLFMDNKLQPDTALTAIFKENPGKLVPMSAFWIL